MKKAINKIIIICIIVILLPFILTLVLNSSDHNKSLETMDFKIYYEHDGKKELLDFNDYLIGVVAANMPAGYHAEALKAQAVIARTYALYNISLLSENKNKKRFNTSEIGLSYISPSSLEQYWGSKDYSSYFTKIENAVAATKNEVLTYEGNLILPVFFDTGCGYTRNASEAWDIDVPYLVSVPSKSDVTSIHYLNISEFEVTDFLDRIKQKYPDIDIKEEDFFDKVKITDRDSTDYALKVSLGSHTVSGEDFAKAMGFNSSHFYMENYEGKVRIICNGVGHGVGFSQYGGNAMAQEGCSYKELLTHYYTGINITDTNGED